MKVSFEKFQQSLAAIPIYPICYWNAGGSDGEDKEFRVVKLEMKINPDSKEKSSDDKEETKFGAYFRVFEAGTPEQWCRWRDDLIQVFKGLGLTKGANQLGMVKHLLAGAPLDAVNEFFAAENVTVSKATVNQALKTAAARIFPDNTVVNQLQYMHHELKNPTN